MNTQLHKTQQGFIVTSGDKIGEKDLILWDGKVKTAIDTSYSYPTQKVIAQQHQLDFSAISEEWCKKIGHFDTVKFARDEHKFNHKIIHEMSFVIGVEIGFQKAQELLSDKKFTLADIAIAFEAGRTFEHSNRKSLNQIEYIQSLTTTTWEITGEWVGNKYKITNIK